MHHITIPSLITWGRHDGILPVPLAQDAYNRIATNRNGKSIVIYEHTAHSPMFEEKTKFNQDVASFMETYK
jgi:pimeloyl-ACP methyl ester carboxylesterase